MYRKILISWLILLFVITSSVFAQTVIKDDFRVNDDYDVGGSNQSYPAIAMDHNGNFVVVWLDQRNTVIDIYGQRFDRLGNPLGENFKVNDTSLARYIYHIDVAMDSDGDFVVVWQDNRSKSYDIYAQRYDSDGSPVGRNFKINNDVEKYPHFCPALAMTPSGEFVVVWINIQKEFHIYGQRFSPSGERIGDNFEVINLQSSGIEQYPPNVAINPKGDFVVTWTALFSKSHQEIHAIRVGAKNEITGSKFKVNYSDTLSFPNRPDVAIDAPGNFVVTWLENRAGVRDIYAQRYNFKGEALGTNFRVNEVSGQSSIDLGEPKIAMKLSKRFVIGWVDSRDLTKSIYLQYYNQFGEPEGDNVKVVDTEYYYPSFIDLAKTPSGDLTITWDAFDCRYNTDIFATIINQRGEIVKEKIKTSKDEGSSSQRNPAIVASSDGQFMISWDDLRYCERDIFAQRFNSSGDFLGSNIKVNQENLMTYYSENSSVSMDSMGNSVVAFLSFSGFHEIHIQRYDYNGENLGENIRVNDTLWGYQPDVAMDLAGNTAVVWAQAVKNQQYRIFTQLFDYQGNKLDSNFITNDFIDSTQYSQNPKVDKCANGNFIVVWWNIYRGRGIDSEIWGQLYNSSGNRIGDNFLISDSSISLSNYYPDVGMDREGNFIVIWYGAGNILIQKFNADGSKNGSITKVLDSNAKVKEFSLAVKSNGEFLVTWADYRNGNPDIYAQRFDAEGNQLGDNFRVNSDVGENTQMSPTVAADEKNYYFSWVDDRGPESGYDIYCKIITFEQTFVSEQESINNPELSLLHNYPNPFNPATRIHFRVGSSQSGAPTHTTLVIYNLLGQKVKTLVDEDRLPGSYQVIWDGKNDEGQNVSSGIYFYVLKTNDLTQTRKMTLVR